MTIFGHRNGFGGYRIFIGVPGVTGTPPGSYWALWALVEWREGGQDMARGPPCPNPNWEGRGRRPPFSFLLSTSSFPLLLFQQGREGVLLPLGVGLLLVRLLLAGRLSPLAPLYTGAGGTPETQQLTIDLLAVCGAPLHHSPPQ